MSKKPVIVFEGVECSGKSYHISMVAKYLKRKRSRIFGYVNLVVVGILKKLEN